VSGSRVAKNSLILLVAEAARKTLGVATGILIARALEVDDYGRLRLAMAIAAIFEVLAGFGLGPLLTREVAARPESGSDTFGLVQSLKLIFSVVAVMAMVAFALLSGYEGATLITIVIASGIVFFSALDSTFISLFDGLQRMEFTGAVSVLRSTLVLVGVLVALGFGWSLYGVIGAYAVAAAASAMAGNAIMAFRLPTISFRPRLKGAWAHLRSATPFLLIGVMWMLLFRIDTIMLENMKNEQSVGLYAAGYSFFELLLTLPILATRALYPALSEARNESPERWHRLLGAAIRVYWLMAFPLAIGSFMVGARFVALFYGEKYALGGYVVPLLGSFIWLWFGTMTLGWAFSAADRLKIVLFANAAAMGVNVAINLLLIPRFDFFGAAAATVISEAFLMIFFIVMLAREDGGLPRNMFPWRVLPAATLMAAAVWWVREMNLILVVAVGASVYFAGVWIFGALSGPERELVDRLIRRKKA
jgi:O-antigen/teichoic acid export membrane protein